MKKRLLFLFFFISSLAVLAGSDPFHRVIAWKGMLQIPSTDQKIVLQPYFQGAQYAAEYGHLPFYSEIIPLSEAFSEISVTLDNALFDIAPEGFEGVEGAGLAGTVINPKATLGFDRGRPVAIVSFLPVRINPYNHQYELLKEFDIHISGTGNVAEGREWLSDFAGNSILAEGTWYKLSVQQTGIHVITYADLQSMGINPASIDPKNIRLYGNGGGMLSESLNDFRRDDVSENAIFVSGESDGKFDQQDYILFYGQSPHEWKYNPLSQAFQHQQNIYSDFTYYFLNTDIGPGKRVASVSSSTEPPNVFVEKFTDYTYHEQDLFNLINTGRVWYGEVFDVTTSYNFSYNFPDIDLSSPAYLRAYVAAKSNSSSYFTISSGITEILSAVISGIPSSSETYARAYVGGDWFMPSSPDINIRIEYEKTSSGSIGWLNFFELNVIRSLSFTGPQMSFRDPSSVAPGSIAEFTLGNAGQGTRIWNVTDPSNAVSIAAQQSGTDRVFRLPQDTLMEFIAFDGSSYLPVVFVEQVANQDLHGSGPVDMVIITHPLFLDQANRLADFHVARDGLSVLVTEIGKVYNEFSSGAQDITAIRDFMKLLYATAPAGEEPKYLLLFGDASFDYKDRIENNSNFVPTWEDDESLTIVYSIVTDDYYGFLDGPGDNILDIGIGRLPVQTPEQAELAVSKIIHYATNTAVVMKDWRNIICFVADDEDANLHLDQAEEMAVFLDTSYGAYNVDKIYVDAFPQISTPGGQRAPEVNAAISSRMNKGALVMNYTGHGGEVGWGHERFLEISDINSWSNYDRMPIFITATCEFSRYDDPERVSAGELVYLNENGGAIAMFTTARATFGGSNFNLNTALFEIMFEEENDGDYYRFGDLIRLAKNKGGVVDNDRKFVLLGDPALQLAYPMYDVFTSKINGEEVSMVPDTLQALSKITIDGQVMSGNALASDFNGTIYPIVFDKPSHIETLDTDPTSQPTTFDLRNNVLYKGKARVEGGQFSFTFIVPKDIAYQYGLGKISYYAEDGDKRDAHGYYNNIMVGGFDQSIEPDETGPDVSLYMNDPGFRFGGITDENPDMLAFVHDESGINTVGSGIGHDIVAILDGNTDKPIILNDFYEADLNSYTSGTIRYPFQDLEEGLHTLSLKVWDVFNNSGEAYIEFNVVSSGKFVIGDLYNYPNPFFEGTTFVFSHNQAEGELDVNLRIYNLSGQIVKTFETTLVPAGYMSEPVYWDGRNDSGGALSKGLYIYRISVRNQEGQVTARESKLILLK